MSRASRQTTGTWKARPPNPSLTARVVRGHGTGDGAWQYNNVAVAQCLQQTAAVRLITSAYMARVFCAGYGVNTFVLVNKEGKETYVKVHTCIGTLQCQL
jgi:catalase